MPRPQLAKLSRPRLHDAVPRERLFRSLDQKRAHPVVWVAGPPGSGKTTLVASYLEASAAQAIWYLLDKGDSDPATFFYYLAQAVEAAGRSPGKPLPLLTEEYLADLEGFARRFLRDAFARLTEGHLVVLDNYHDIAADSPLHGMLNAALSEVPQSANLLVISRALPPALYARARVGGLLETLEWEELRLEPKETSAIAARRDVVAPEVVAALHSQSGGWVAGVRLLLEGTMRRNAEALSNPEMLESAFDYFAAEIFDSAAAPVQQLLLRTSFPPRFTARMAVALSGDEVAARRIEDLYRRRLFVDRRAGAEVTYQYHDLFRAFLRSRAAEVLSGDEVAAVIRESAKLMLEAGLADEAFTLFVQARSWDHAERIFLAQAKTLIGRGRWQTLEDWGKSLPAPRLDANPWLRYWLGRSKALVDATQAFPILEGAYTSFVEKDDRFGELLSAATAVEALHFVVDRWDTMGTWLERLVKALDTQDAALAPEDELRVHAGLFWAADNSKDPSNPVVSRSVARCLALLPLCEDVNLRVTVANMLQYHSERTLDAQASAIAAREARLVLDSPELSADRHALYYLSEGFAHVDFGRPAAALECYDRADAIIEANGLLGRDHIAGVWRALCQYAAGQQDAARATLARTEKLKALDLHVITHVLENARAWIAFGDADNERALRHNQRSLDIAETLGPYCGVSVLLPHRAYMLIASRRYQSAGEALETIRCQRHLVEYEHVGGAISLLQAWLALRSGDEAYCRAALVEALAAAHDERQRLRIRWYPKALEALLPTALAEGIEVETARILIRESAMAPPPAAPETWPWPVRIYTLGRFEIMLDDAPLEFGRKAPKRTIALLKALIALGGTEVAEQRLADALWSDVEGDTALESLAATLHRLRRLLGGSEAIRLSNGALSLNEQRCFVDAWAFERSVDEGRCSSALDLYRGDFLRGDNDASWGASMRERLRNKFVRAVESTGRDLEARAQYQDAVALYLRGIEADDLVEPFYRGLMRSYHRLDRPTDAATAFRRLRQVLSVTLGAKPSAESQALFNALRLQ